MEHFIFCVLSVLVGIVGVTLTIFDLPGNGLMLLSIFAYAFMTENEVRIPYLLLVTIVYLLGEIWEAGMSFLGIKKEKVSWTAVLVIGIGGFAGTVVGTGFFPVLGSFIGGCIGAYLASFAYIYFTTKDRRNAKYIARQAAKVRFLAILGKLVAGLVLAVLLVHMVW